MTAPPPALYAPGEPVLACGLPAVVTMVCPPDRWGRRLYGVRWPTPPGSFGEVGIVEEGELVPVGRA